MQNSPIFDQNPEICDKTNPYFESLLRNLNAYLGRTGMSINKFAAKTGVPIETVRSIMYRKTNTCRIATAVLFAKELDMTLDELFDSGLVSPTIAEELHQIKNFTETERELLRWYIRKIDRRHQKHPGEKFVTVMSPVCLDGALKSTNDYSIYNVATLPKNVAETAFFGIVVPCEHYMPHYVKGQTILISSDRKPRLAEHCVINVDNSIYIASYYEEEGKPKFKSIINKRPFSFSITLDDVVGYVSHVVDE